jgi:hypothetical protein
VRERGGVQRDTAGEGDGGVTIEGETFSSSSLVAMTHDGLGGHRLRQDDFRQNMMSGVFWITPCIAQGAFPSEKMIAHLLAHNVTHILNVGTTPLGPEVSSPPFREVIWRPFPDLVRIPDQTAIDCMDVMFRVLQISDSRIYLHCLAGQNRSPTILWLFLMACGVSPASAQSMIEDRTLDAVAGHPCLIDGALVKTIRAHGKRHFQPLQRPQMVEAVEMS